ncbi:MAG: response regulator transcription factor [Phycisphaeraceae bacterium]
MSAYLNLLLADDECDHATLLRQSLDSVTELTFDLCHATDLSRALVLAEDRLLDAIFIDYHLGPDGGLALVHELRHRGDRRPMVLLTACGDAYVAVEALRNGADDYIARCDLNTPRLTAVVERITNRTHELEAQARTKADLTLRIDSLTPKERQVMDLMVEGMTTHEIASALTRSDNTVKIHRSHVLQKMHAHTCAELTHMVLDGRLEDVWDFSASQPEPTVSPDGE